MAKIKHIKAREILASNGIPTVECFIGLDNNSFGVASVPAGISIGTHEAKELRDGDPERYWGMGAKNSVYNIEQAIGPKIMGMDPRNQAEIDHLMIQLDGTEDKKKLGANSILAISIACCKAAAMSSGLPLFVLIAHLNRNKEQGIPIKIPLPMALIIEGGEHGSDNLNFQEFLVVPAPAKRRSFSDNLIMIAQIYHSVGKILGRNRRFTLVGDEGGYVPSLYANVDAIDLISQAISQTQFRIGTDVFLSLDIAASTFYANGYYTIKDRTTSLTSQEMFEYYNDLVNQYRILSIEDPFAEDEWNWWEQLTRSLGSRVMIVGDDLIATNKQRLDKAIKNQAINAVIIKPNQIGTITETLEVVKIARAAGYDIIVSHRAGETNDAFIADFAVGIGAGFAKLGAVARGERVAKYNRLLEIESILPRIKL